MTEVPGLQVDADRVIKKLAQKNADLITENAVLSAVNDQLQERVFSMERELGLQRSQVEDSSR